MNYAQRVAQAAGLDARSRSSEAIGLAGATLARGAPVSSRKRLLPLLLASGICAQPAFADGPTLPTNGNVVAGSGSISQSGNAMTVTQGSSRLAIDWQTFSIGQGASVNFVQPSTSAVALNRVLGSDVSRIQGSLTANGQVFLINPNGVLFTPTAQVNVGGLVASTLSLGNADFMAGNYRFTGGGGSAIVNQGNLIAANGGTIALIAAKVDNAGTIDANRGNALLGAGSDVTLDLGGPVKLQVNQGALDALISNGGAIKADGGVVYLTAKAANTLAATVINTTGVIEAQTLATGEKGQIVLLGGMTRDRIMIGGTLDASAPNGGDGGFIETSAAKVNFADDLRVTTTSAQGGTGTWLIDPLTFTVAASGGDITGAALQTQLGGTDITLQADNTVTIDDAVSWSANKLTLLSGGDIAINADLIASGTASLAFAYGQATANGAGSTYTVADGVQILIPSADNFTWQKGSGGTVNNLIFDNGNLRFGDEAEVALTSEGQLKQPFYYNNAADDPSGRCDSGEWCKLTYSTYPLDVGVGTGGDGSNSWNIDGEILSTGDNLEAAYSGLSIDIARYREGTGTIVASGVLTFSSGDQVKLSNSYTLDSGTQYLKTVSSLTNLSAGSVDNVRLWVGTRDDYVAGVDSNYKLKGNLTGNGFELITDQNQQAKALKVSNSDTNDGTGVLFYSTSSGADTVSDQCCDFTNVINKDPRSSEIVTGREDGSYGLFIRFADLAVGQSDNLTWYYAAAPLSQLGDVIASVGQSAGITPGTPSTPTTIPQTSAVTQAQITATNLSQTPTAQRPAPSSASIAYLSTGSPQGNSTVLGSSGGLVFVAAPQAPADTSGSASGGGASDGASAPPPPQQQGGIDPSGFMRVFVVDGGINMPRGAESEEGNPIN